jgi:signal transduction histidine kinase
VLESTRAELAEALAELRELARGLHPAVVSRGLEAALSGLADRAPLPVELDIEPGEDPPEAVTATAYYVVAEALTNVARYAGATRARVAARSADGVGRGGARLRPGSGLEGLADRVAAVGGTFAVDSSPGAGTRITARIPLS